MQTILGASVRFIRLRKLRSFDYCHACHFFADVQEEFIEGCETAAPGSAAGSSLLPRFAEKD
jgi:hypothetical protein